MHVLVVDDDLTTLAVIQARLEAHGVRVTTRHQSLGTSAAILQIQPDMVLLDLNMPGLPGDELIRLLTERNALQRTSIILHSSLDPHALEAVSKDSGALGFLPKTNDQAKFLRLFDELVRKHKARFTKPSSHAEQSDPS